jgi:type I restriction enzyme M protein
VEPPREKQEREATLNQAPRREANERQLDGSHEEQIEFVCECSKQACKELISLRVEECEFVRRAPNRLVVRMGHVDYASEHVIMEEPGRNQATWRICRMNLAIHGLSGDVKLGDSLLDNKFAGSRADFVMANPPFNMKKWGAASVAKDARWAYGEPPDQNANYAWIQHFIHHLTPDGRAGFVMANGSLTSNTRGEGEIRQKIVEADLVDSVVALPGQLFFTTAIPVCLWFVDRNKTSSDERDRRDETLFVDARAMGQKISRTQIDLTDDEIRRIAGAYHAWRGEAEAGAYEDVPGFCKAATLSEIEQAGFALTPGRYVGAAFEEEDEATFDERMRAVVGKLRADFAEAERLGTEVKKALGALGYEL